jgi:hypothetical protein
MSSLLGRSLKLRSLGIPVVVRVAGPAIAHLLERKTVTRGDPEIYIPDAGMASSTIALFSA